MLHLNDYVSVLFKGIGKVTEVNNGRVKVNFRGSSEWVNEEEASYIFPEFATFLMLEDYRSFFSHVTVSKGYDYYREGRVSSAVMMGKTISGTVYGSDEYQVSIAYQKMSLRCRCTCPVGSMCKHSVAVLKYVSEIFKGINTTSKNMRMEESSPVRLDFTSRSVVDEVLTYVPSFLSIKAFSDMLEGKDGSFYDSLYDYIKEKHVDFSRFTDAKDILAFSDSKFEALSKASGSVLESSFYQDIKRVRALNEKFLREATEDVFITSYSIKSASLYFITNNEYDRYARYLFLEGNTVDITTHLSRILPFLKDMDSLISEYGDYVRRYTDLSSVTSLILGYIPEESKTSFFTKNPKIHAPYAILKSMGIKDSLSILSSHEISEEESRFIMERFYLLKEENENLTLSLLFYAGYMYKNLRSDIIRILGDDPSSSWMCDFLRFKERKTISYTDSSLYENVTLSFEIKRLDESYTIFYKISCGASFIYLASRVEDEPYNFEDEDYRKIPDIISCLVKEIEEMDSFKDAIKEEVCILKEKKAKKLTMEYSNAIDEFFSSDVKSLSVFDDAHKIKIEIHADSDPISLGYALSLRLGNDKMYMVKNLSDFLTAVENEDSVYYGKSLEFVHRMDNFTENAKKFISFLLKANHAHFLPTVNHKGLYIPYYLFLNLLDELKGDTIYLDEKPVFLRLDEFIPKVYIDEKYILRTNLEGIILKGGMSHIYLPDLQVIDHIRMDDSMKKILSFAIDHPMDVSLVRDKFINQVYSRYKDSIEISDSLKADFKLAELKIRASFDYDDKEIRVTLSYFKEDKEIQASEIENLLDKEKVNTFNLYLESLGFQDDRLISEEDIYHFFMMDFSYLNSMAEVYLSTSITNKKIMTCGTPQVKISYENSMMTMFMEESSYSEEELYEIYSGIRRKKKYILLRDDRIIDLDNDEARDFYDTVSDMEMDPKRLLSSQNAPIYYSFNALSHERNVKTDDFLKEMITSISKFKESNEEIPNVSATLRQYQKEGFYWMKILSSYHLGGILADDMGLGKTLEVITLLKSDDTNMPSLIVCPKSLLFNWVSEFEKFDCDAPVVKILGSATEREKIISSIRKDEKKIYITGYDSLRMDVAFYSSLSFNFLILDEAQAIKNVHAMKSQSVKNINARNRFALTGTPIENSVLDLWSIFDFLMPGYFSDITTFKRRYESEENYARGIAKKCAPFILRRTKEEVLKDLPSKFERIVSADMSIEQRKIYDAHILDARRKMESGSGAFEVLPYLMRLRQICISPSLFMENFEGKSGKMEELHEILEDYIPKGHRILIFSSFVSALSMVEDYLRESLIPYLILTGETKPEERLRLVDSFNSDEEYKVFLISLKAGGTGLNLTGADTVIHLDPWWNVSAENQATDRAHRIGQKRNVEVIKLVADDSVEQKVIELQNLKKDIIDKVISKDDSSVTGITLEDMRFILE